MFRRKPKNYLISYATPNGFGRVTITHRGPISAEIICEWERKAAELGGFEKTVTIGIFPIDGPIETPNQTGEDL